MGHEPMGVGGDVRGMSMIPYNCFDSLKNPIPCPVVTVPEPWGAAGWELLIFGVGIALALWMARRWGWKW